MLERDKLSNPALSKKEASPMLQFPVREVAVKSLSIAELLQHSPVHYLERHVSGKNETRNTLWVAVRNQDYRVFTGETPHHAVTALQGKDTLVYPGKPQETKRQLSSPDNSPLVRYLSTLPEEELLQYAEVYRMKYNGNKRYKEPDWIVSGTDGRRNITIGSDTLETGLANLAIKRHGIELLGVADSKAFVKVHDNNSQIGEPHNGWSGQERTISIQPRYMRREQPIFAYNSDAADK